MREEVSALIKTVDDKDTAQELAECNRRLAELREEIAVFLSQSARDHVYWVERTGKTQRNLALNAAPIDVADFLRQRLFEADTSVIMTSATLAVRLRRIRPAKRRRCITSPARSAAKRPPCCRPARRSITSGR